MKLVFVTDNGFSSHNGSYYYSAANIQHYLTLTNIFEDITFIARKNSYENTENKISSNYKTILLEPYYGSARSLNRFREINRTLDREIKDSDIVIAFGINGYLAYRKAKKYNKPVISYVGACIYDTLSNMDSVTKKIMAPIMKRLVQNMVKKSDYVHYVDDYLLERYPTEGKILVCPSVIINIDKDLINKRIEKQKVKSKEIKLGIIGYTHNKIKGIDTIIKSMEYLPKNIKLEVVGRGEHSWLDALTNELNLTDRVEFLGTINNREKLFNWLDQIDIYLQPSLTEGMPRATLEAMSRGCPVISSSAGGLKTIIEDDYRINAGNENELANKIMKLNTDRAELKRVSIINFETAKLYNFNILNKKRNEFYMGIYTSLKNKIS